LDDAVTACKEAVEVAPKENLGDRAMYWCSLGNILEARAKTAHGSLDDLNPAVKAQHEAVGLVPDNDPNRPMYVSSLGTSLLSRYKATMNTTDWDGSVEAYQQATALSVNNLQLRATCLQNVNIALVTRIERSINTPEVEWRATVNAVDRVKSSSPEILQDPGFLLKLGNLFLQRFQATSSMTDLDATVKLREDLVKITPDAHPDKGLHLGNLGGILQHRFEMTGQLKDADAAIEYNKKAVDLLPQTHPSKAAALDNLGGGYWRRAERTGSLDDLNIAIERLVEAVGHSIPDFHKAYRLNNLAGALSDRAGLTGSIDDLNAAVIAWKQAVELLPRDNPERPGILSSLSNSLRTHFERFGGKDTLDASVEVNREAVATTPEHYPCRPGHLGNLGLSLYRRAGLTESYEDANDAVLMIEEAVKSTQDEQRESARFLTNLSSALLLRYKFSIEKSPSDLDYAVNVQEKALKLTPLDHPERSLRLRQLGDALETRFKVTNSTDDRNAAINAFEEAAEFELSPPRQRIISARRAVDLLSTIDVERSSKLLTTAVNLLPAANPRAGHRDDKQAILSQFSGLASDAAALSIRAAEKTTSPNSLSEAQISEALRLLELGRGVMASAYFDTRSDITELKNSHPELAKKFESLREELDRTTDRVTSYASSPDASTIWGSQMTRRIEASKEFDATIKFIRSQEGFQSFLQGPSSSELKTLATGPIVYINVSRFGADAFLITRDDIRHLRLSKLSFEELKHKAEELATTLGTHTLLTYRSDTIKVRKILEWLWDVAIEPILEQLGFTDAPGDNTWPRVIWVPVGLLSLFPIHAAGYFSPNGNRTAIDRVISMYVPTLRALGHARAEVKARANQSKSTVLVVSMPSTPNQNPLPYAIQEAHTVDECLPHSVERVVLESPTKKDVLQHLEQSSIVHLACHGELDRNPSNSQLLFQDWETNPFRVSDMAAADLDKARLAILSACHAANMRDVTLLDEAIHMAGACQLAGFPTVIGTLWQVQDQHSPTISAGLYRAMLMENGELDVEKAAEGLHFAVRKVREGLQSSKVKRGRGSDDPMAWAPYIHVGV
jgi:tetratricopeptide (TPR) repeat protein